MYGYFNKTFWKKVEAYGKDRMESDVKKLRTLREDRQIQRKPNPKATQIYRRVPPSVDARNHEVYEQIRGNIYEDKYMADALREKIIREDESLNSKQASDIAEYMIQYKGGCPIK